MKSKTIKIIAFLLCFSLLVQQSGFTQVAGQLDISSYLSGLRSSLAQDKFRPLHLRYLSYDSLNNNFKLLLDKGDSKDLQEANLKVLTQELLNYFFIGLTLPNSSFWVNLRPDSPENIIDDYLAQTEIGRILLEADLQLKKDTASCTSPQTPEGKKYWGKLYQKAEEFFGSENITIPTLTRPWIVPGEIIIREAKDNAYIYKATLKVMLEQDYLRGSATYNFSDPRLKALNEYSSQLIRELIIPKLTKEINTSKRYAPLRQVYYSLILAQWFKSRFYGKGGLYSSRIDKRDLTGLISTGSWSKIQYFKEYQKSFQDGEYNLKEPIQTPFGQSVRSYFSGGIQLPVNLPLPGKTITDPATSSPVTSINAKRDFPFPDDKYLAGIASGAAGGLRVEIAVSGTEYKPGVNRLSPSSISGELTLEESRDFIELWKLGMIMRLEDGYLIPRTWSGSVNTGDAFRGATFTDRIKALQAARNLIAQPGREVRLAQLQIGNLGALYAYLRALGSVGGESAPALIKKIEDIRTVYEHGQGAMILGEDSVLLRFITRGEGTPAEGLRKKVQELLLSGASSPVDLESKFNGQRGWVSKPEYLSWLSKTRELIRTKISPAEPVRVYYYGAGGGRSSITNGIEPIDIISPLLATDFDELYSYDSAEAVSENVFQNVLNRQLQDLGIQERIVPQKLGSTLKFSFSYEGRPRTVIATYGKDATREFPPELLSGFGVLYSRGIPVVFRDMQLATKTALLDRLKSKGGFLVMESLIDAPISIEGFRRVEMGDTSWAGEARRLDVFEAASSPTEDMPGQGNLAELIQQDIRNSGGKIAFANFMSRVQRTYYDRVVSIGREGHFTTYAERPIFAQGMALQLVQMWLLLGQPKEFRVVEMGAGNGTLAKNVLDWLKGNNDQVYQALTYTIVDISTTLKREQDAQLRGHVGKVAWKELSELRDIEGVFISNEFVDALPVHLVRKAQGKLWEVRVTYNPTQQAFQEELGELSNAQLDSYAQMIAEGEEAAVSLEISSWQEAIAQALRRGFVITIDYGGTRAEIAERLRKGEALIWSGAEEHIERPEIYRRVASGQALDMTYLVPFDEMIASGRFGGLKEIGYGALRDTNLSPVGPDPEPSSYVTVNKSFKLLVQAKGVDIAMPELFAFKKTSSPVQENRATASSPAEAASGKDVIGASLRSASIPVAGEPGGIDFRALPIVTQPIAQPASFNRGVVGGLKQSLSSVNLTEEWQQIQKILSSGIIPSSERIKEYVGSCSLEDNMDEQIDKVLSFIADILRLEEERCLPTEAGLKELLVSLESS